MFCSSKYLIKYSNILSFVAARNSHFCLARNLIRPLGSTQNFTQSGWLILFTPNQLSGQHKLGKSAKHSLFRRTTSFCTDVYRLHFNSSSSIMTPWGKQSNLWTPCLFFLDQGFPVEYGLDTFNTPHTGTTLSSSSSSSYRAGSTDIPDPLSPLFPIVHRPR